MALHVGCWSLVFIFLMFGCALFDPCLNNRLIKETDRCYGRQMKVVKVCGNEEIVYDGESCE